MSDDIKKIEIPEEELNALKERASYLEKEAKTAFQKRDEAKKALQEFENKKLEEQQQYKELADKYKIDFETTSKALEDAKKLAEQATSKLTTYETQTRNELIKDLPDGDLKEIASKLDLTDLKKFVEVNKKQTAVSDKTRNVKNASKENKPKTFQEWKQLYS